MARKARHFTRYAGDYFFMDLYFLDDDGKPLPLTDATVKWGLALTPRDDAIVNKSTDEAEEIEVINILGGHVRCYVQGEDTVDLAPRRYHHEARVIDTDGHAEVMIEGQITILPSILN